jgi:DNA-binding transcriptional LysR family regulator
MIDFRRLRQFVAVAETGNFHSASRRLNLAQPAISRQVKSLEADLGVELFIRHAKGVQLTQAGRCLMEGARKIFADLEQLTAATRRAGSGQVGCLRVAFSEIGSGNGIIPRAISAFQAAEPAVDLDLTTMDSANQILALRLQEIDAGFTYLAPPNDAELDSLNIESGPMLLAIPKAHRLAHREKITVDLVKGETIVCVSDKVNGRLARALSSTLKAQSVTLKLLTATSGAEVVSLVSAGIGLGLVGPAMTWHLPEDIIAVPLVELDMVVNVALAWRRDNVSGPLSGFIEIVRMAIEPHA